MKNTRIQAIALWLAPLLLAVPNIALAFTEQLPLIFRLANIVLPLGLYYLLFSLSRSVGRTILCFIPLMVYDAFQIVLLFLYGGSIIAVDMLLNVFTTNPQEAGELLSNLGTAIMVVVALYLPPIACALWMVAKRKRAQLQQLMPVRRAGWAGTAVGAVLLALCYVGYADYSSCHYLYPVNVAYNTVLAVERNSQSCHYAATSADFTYEASCLRDTAQSEVYVLVIGETSRADNWQLMGYGRPTNPKLTKQHNLYAYPKTLSESNTTHKSVPMLLSHLDSRNFGDSIIATKSIITAFKEAGYSTAFISAQQPNHSYIDYFGEEADTCIFIRADGSAKHDHDLVPELQRFIDGAHGKTFVVLHSYGSHFNYRDRYDADETVFGPDDYAMAQADDRDKLINAYDNTIVATDTFLDAVIESLKCHGGIAGMVYASDHGEDIFDDDRGRFLHASPTPTYYQVHVPMLVWMSTAFVSEHPTMAAEAFEHRNLDVSSTKAVFNTMIEMAGVSTPYFDPVNSLVSDAYAQPERMYVNDYNQPVALSLSGIRHQDLAKLSQMESVVPNGLANAEMSKPE